MTDTDESSSRSPSPPMRKKMKRTPTIKSRKNIEFKAKKGTTTDIEAKRSSDAPSATGREPTGKPGMQMRNLKSWSTSEVGSESSTKTFAERHNLQGGKKTRVAKPLMTDLADRQLASVAKPVEEEKKTKDSKRKKKSREKKGKTLHNEMKQSSDAPAARGGPEPGNRVKELTSRPTSEDVSRDTERDPAEPGDTSGDPQSFFVDMKPSMISNGFWMGVPKKTRAYMPSSETKVSLVREFRVTYKAPEVETPPGKMGPRKGGAFSGGWNAFARENHLKSGDRITFTKLDNSYYTFLVAIKRKSEDKDGAVRVNKPVRDVPPKKERKEQGSRPSNKKISSSK